MELFLRKDLNAATVSTCASASTAFSRGALALAALFIVAIGIVYNHAIVWLVKAWMESGEQSHGFLIPPLVCYLVWIKKDHLKQLSAEPSIWLGSAALLLSGALLLMGRAGFFIQLEVFSMLAIFPSLVLFMLGWRHLKALVIAFAYLLFMFPWTDELGSVIHRPFQLLAANLGTQILTLAGYTVHRNTVFIEFPNFVVEVARECSGVNYLTAVLAFGVILVYLTQKTMLRAIIVVVSGLVMAVFANSIRVALACNSAFESGIQMLHGPSHIYKGWFVAQVGLVALLLFNWFVGRRSSSSRGRLYEKWRLEPCQSSNTCADLLIQKRVGAAFAALAAMGVILAVIGAPKPTLNKRPLSALPAKIGEWQSIEYSWLKADEFFVKADEQLTRTYQNPSGQRVHVHISYFRSQNQERRLISYRLRRLHQGAVVVPVAIEGLPLHKINLGSAAIGAADYEIAFWYELSGHIATSRYIAKLIGIYNMLIHSRADGAAILIACDSGGVEQKESLPLSIHAFLKDAGPMIQRSLR